MLYDHLPIKSHDLISLVGAGGKTAVMFQLARELKQLNAKVLVTTTTAIYQPEPDDYDSLVIADWPGTDEPGVTVWAREITAENKLLGFDPDLIDEIFKRRIFDYVLVEADGAKRLPVKAPARHEPPVPTATTIGIGIIGLDCLGAKANAQNVHRSDIWCQLVGAEPNEEIKVTHLSHLIAAKNGLFKNLPATAKHCLLLNQVNTPIRLQAARSILAYLPSQQIILDRFIIADINTGFHQTFDPSVRITGVILASGLSRRLPGNKLLLDYQGQPLVEWVIKAAVASKLQDIVLIFGDEIVKAIGSKYGLQTVFNPCALNGQSEAVKLGVAAVSPKASGIMFLPGDQPLISPNVINQLITNFDQDSFQVVQPFYASQPGSPVLFNIELREDLLSLIGDTGGRSLIKDLPLNQVKRIDIDDSQSGIDVDTIEDYYRLQALAVRL